MRRGDVGHQQRVFRVADVEPAGDLPRGETRHAHLAAQGGEFFGRFAVQCFAVSHFFVVFEALLPHKSRQKMKIFAPGRAFLNFYPYICGA